MEYKVPDMRKFTCGKCKRDREFHDMERLICCGITYVRTYGEKRGKLTTTVNVELLQMLKELCLEQHKIMKFVSKVNHQTLMSELKKSDGERDNLLIDLAGGTLDCLNDPNDKSLEIILKLESEYGMNFRSRGE